MNKETIEALKRIAENCRIIADNNARVAANYAVINDWLSKNKNRPHKAIFCSTGHQCGKSWVEKNFLNRDDYNRWIVAAEMGRVK